MWRSGRFVGGVALEAAAFRQKHVYKCQRDNQCQKQEQKLFDGCAIQARSYFSVPKLMA